MSTTTEIKYKLADAKRYADRVVAMLAPYCHRIEIAGSVRRNKPEVKDIEIVCIPKRVHLTGLFDTQEGDPVPEFIETVNKFKKVKGSPTGKYTQRILPVVGIKLDLFIATPENWGYQFAIRTGSAEFSKKLAQRWVSKGYKGEDGMLTANGKPVIVREEADLFQLLGWDFVEPENRM